MGQHGLSQSPQPQNMKWPPNAPGHLSVDILVRLLRNAEGCWLGD